MGKPRPKPKVQKKGGGRGGGNKGYRPPRPQSKDKGKFGSGGQGQGQVNKTEEKVKMNPFEVQVNKRKHETLGRRGREEHGHPGLAKSRGIVKRKKTLLTDYLSRSKTNSFVDRRIGERSQSLPEEDKIVRRSALEKKKQYKKKSIFNLNDEEDDILTHRGQSLSAAGRYEDPRESSDSEDERLNEEFVSEANFGGFMKRKVSSRDDDGEENSEMTEKSRAQIVAELILASKQKKGKKSADDAALYEKIRQLDDTLKEKSSLIEDLRLKSGGGPTPAPTTQSDYDRAIKELQFERRGQATNRLKTPEEIAEEKKNKLEQMEKERLANMQRHGMDVGGGPTYQSADSLGPSFTSVEESGVLAYSDGKIIKSSDSESSDGDEDDSAQEDSDTELVKSNKAVSDKETFHRTINSHQNKMTTSITFPDVPYNLTVPKSFKKFFEFYTKFCPRLKNSSTPATVQDLKSYNTQVQTFLDRITEYNEVANPSALPKLCEHILHMYELVERNSSEEDLRTLFVRMESYLPALHKIVTAKPSVSQEFLEAIAKANKMFSRENVPQFLVGFFLMISRLFSVTDFKHKVVSPAKVFLLRILHDVKLDRQEIVRQVLPLCGVTYEYTKGTKQYCPEIVVLLQKLLRFCINKTDAGCPESEYIRISQEILYYVNKFVKLYQGLPSAVEIFEPFKPKLADLKKTYQENAKLQEAVDSIVINSITEITAEKECLATKRPKPKMLRMYEPEISLEPLASSGKRRRKSERGDEGRLAAKVKKETKGAIRELKKDNAFLGRQQRKEETQNDAERAGKVKALMGSLANQEGEYQKLQKKK